MLKKIGFIVVLIGIMFLLRPQLFMGLFSSNTPETPPTTNTPEPPANTGTQRGNTSNDKYDNQPNLMAKNNKATKGSVVVSDDGVTEYAPGYSEKDFGKAFEPPMPEGNEGQPSPGGIWDDLLTLKFKIEYDESIDDVVFKPQFTENIRRHAGKTVEITGYIIPNETVVNAMGNQRSGMFMFSAFPNQSCFFCGGAGPESVMEVYPKKPISYSKETVTIKGKLELNDSDFLRMAYILKDAYLVE